MNVRFSIPLLLLCVASSPACSKKKAEEANKTQRHILDEMPEVPNKLDVLIGDKVELLGAKLEPKGPLKPGQKFKATFYWRAKEKVDDGYVIFTHILDSSGERIGQIDNSGILRRGKWAILPSAWEVGKIYVDTVEGKVPGKIKTDRMQLVVGLGKGTGDDRLPITRGNKDSQNRTLALTATVNPEGGDKDKKPKVPRLPAATLEKLEPSVKIKIDGKLDEEAWKTAPVLGPFVDVKSGEPNKTFPVNGSARMLWNDEALFVGFEVTDPDIVGGFKKTEKDPHLWTQDAVELMIDPGPEGDNEDYYEIQIGPQNLVFDTQFDKYMEPKTEPDGPFGHQEWASNLKSAVVVDGTLDKPGDEDKGYVVEASIPWKSFAKAKTTPPALGDIWRINLYAMQANDGVAWSPILGQGTFHKASRFGKIRFGAKGAGPTPPGSASGAPNAAPSGAPSAAPSAAVRGGLTPSEVGAAKIPTPKPAGSAH